MDMQDISFKHKLEVRKSGWAYYDVAEGDVVEIHYDAHSVSVGHTVGKITEIGVESIIVDSSSKHHSNILSIKITDIMDIKVTQ